MEQLSVKEINSSKFVFLVQNLIDTLLSFGTCKIAQNKFVRIKNVFLCLGFEDGATTDMALNPSLHVRT